MAAITRDEVHAPGASIRLPLRCRLYLPHFPDALSPAVVLQMKAAANRMYSCNDYFGAASIYSTILNQFTQNMPPILVRIVQCNRAACSIELGELFKTIYASFKTNSYFTPSNHPFIVVGRYQDAVPDLQEVIRVHVDTCDGLALTQKAHFRLARCYCELGRYGDAMQEMESYRELIGGQPKLAETSLYTKILGGIINREQAAGQSSSPPSAHFPHHARGPVHHPTDGKPHAYQLRYEIRVFDIATPIIRYDIVPAALCTSDPPEMQTRIFLANLVKKYHNEVMKLHPWTCWNCPARAVSLVHTPASYIHLSDPQVVDFAQPVCINGGVCEKAAREMMNKEMRLVAAQAKAAI